MSRLRPSLRGRAPGTRFERELWQSGHDVVVGVDEVGKGAWAGPLTVGVVCLPIEGRIPRVRDSKLLTPGERETVFDVIFERSAGSAVGHASHRECDDLGMSDAQRLATRRAFTALGMEIDHALVDGKWDFVSGAGVQAPPSTTIVKGDRHSLSIAAASIVAKVTRDRLMAELSVEHPHYAFELNKGYPSPYHRAALQGYGPSRVHRRSWAFMDDLCFRGPDRRPAQASLF